LPSFQIGERGRDFVFSAEGIIAEDAEEIEIVSIGFSLSVDG
jgi:hypothetical protein